MEPMIPDNNVEILAREMIKNFPADAADQATLRSSAFFAMGYAGKSKKWMLVRAEIKKILAAADPESGLDCNRRKLIEIPSGLLTSR
jgi:hypothetical protein